VKSASNTKKPFDLSALFLNLQKQMIAKLETERTCISHPGTQGDARELCWIEMLDSYLPKRYKVKKAFVVDSKGRISEQIDVVLFDQHYSPFLFHQDGAYYVPAEAVYAVFEIKPDLNKGYLDYAGSKVASVRSLFRTSAPIPYAAGKYAPRPLFEILAGILTEEVEWKPPFDKSFLEAIGSLPPEGKIDIGCALKVGAFNIKYKKNKEIRNIEIEEGNPLIFFFLNLLSRMQRQGTASAIDLAEYAKSIGK
jgi:hypothetical protein